MNPIKWYRKVNKTTIKDAHGTYKLLIKSPVINQTYFKKLIKNGKYINISVTEYKKLKPLNAGLFRFSAKTPEEAYKINPNKTHDDYKSLKYLISTNDYLSPIILLKTNEYFIKLDGVHRTLAAKFRKSKIRILIIDIEDSVILK